ncbi:hypothetical protein EWB00_005041 [Schistosoma japonicum]|uniref:Endoplasmic reticulum targeting sequence,domain-containing protein n=1 Tax=Schistosoma japonicum TaxID=6182 RepID=C1LES0_SCHJA|nr:Endoplasmic reticulum targeting sequence [Schistosoma japonicum]TNN10931.1 hypothetical protein EWB00_005041 [Schistosoma japonicum]CAX73198.1 Endoplasmic reticulum targeting sequence,domain-containing protein [Schistosoma japonicum]
MHTILILCFSMTIYLVKGDDEQEELDLSTAIITDEMINAGLHYVNQLNEWLEKNVGKKEIKTIKQNVIKYGQLALNLIDSTIQNLLKDDDNDEDKGDEEQPNSRSEHNEL